MRVSIPDFLRGAVTRRLTAGLQADGRSQPDEREGVGVKMEDRVGAWLVAKPKDCASMIEVYVF